MIRLFSAFKPLLSDFASTIVFVIASILTSGLLGEQYVGLDAGGDTNNLKDGGEIKLTQSAMVLEKLIGQFLYGKASEGATNNK
jgi:phospholipid/cholesterol/gamma-HCH transport system substrate-binding protein